MERITSFSVNHTKLTNGVYVSWIDGELTTFDIRMTTPNLEPALDPRGAHTIEHIGATLLRNGENKDKIIYFGPMGCRTGFYMILAGDLTSNDVLQLVKDMFLFIKNYEGDIPGASAKDCGNYLDLNLYMAKFIAAKYYDILSNITPEQLVYPE